MPQQMGINMVQRPQPQQQPQQQLFSPELDINTQMQMPQLPPMQTPLTGAQM